jgi:cell wall-associated NlpC family hydrolase
LFNDSGAVPITNSTESATELASTTRRALRESAGPRASIARVKERSLHLRRNVRNGIVKAGVLLGAVAIIAPIAIPAYGVNPVSTGADESSASITALGATATTEAQDLALTDDTIAATSRDGYDAQAPVKVLRNALSSSYSGPTAADYVANPPYSSYDVATMLSVAQSYIGTPYVYGGATPAGFDCSGFIMFVMSQFGIALPHSVTGQAALGIKIAPADALPGDLVIMPGHDGIYMGNGMILHAPRPGTTVRIQPLWSSNYYFVRLGT